MTTPAAEHDGRRFDRFPSQSPLRGNFLLEEVLPSQDPRPKTWTSTVVTDQGREGACVGHAVTADLLSSPYPQRKVSAGEASAFAFRRYKQAQGLDPWFPEDYDGTSVDAGFKAIRAGGWIDSWRWMYNVDQVRDAVIAVGPVVLGINWYSDMYSTRPSGLVNVGGSVVGGHAITIIGYHPSMRIRGEDWNSRYEVFKWKNSWGTDYGKNGVGYILASDLATLLSDRGEAAVALGRKSVTRESVLTI